MSTCARNSGLVVYVPSHFGKAGYWIFSVWGKGVWVNVGEDWRWSCAIDAAFWCICCVIKLMRAVVWSTRAVGGGIGWGGVKDVIGIEDYKVMLRGAASVCYWETVFVIDHLGLRMIHAASEDNGAK